MLALINNNKCPSLFCYLISNNFMSIKIHVYFNSMKFLTDDANNIYFLIKKNFYFMEQNCNPSWSNKDKGKPIKLHTQTLL